MINTKKIDYRGILKFYIPFNWVEEYDEMEGGTFYGESPDSGTLRLKLISANTPKDSKVSNASKILEDIISKGSESILLPNNNAFKMLFEQTIESGSEITIFYWHLLQFLEPNHVRLANFSYTVLTNQLEIESVRKEIDFISEQVKNAKYSKK